MRNFPNVSDGKFFDAAVEVLRQSGRRDARVPASGSLGKIFYAPLQRFCKTDGGDQAIKNCNALLTTSPQHIPAGNEKFNFVSKQVADV